MKIKIDRYTISINEDSLVGVSKTKWINDRVKSFLWTGIKKEVLKEKFSEVYDIMNGLSE